jgi:hypothetical protein
LPNSSREWNNVAVRCALEISLTQKVFSIFK